MNESRAATSSTSFSPEENVRKGEEEGDREGRKCLSSAPSQDEKLEDEEREKKEKDEERQHHGQQGQGGGNLTIFSKAFQEIMSISLSSKKDEKKSSLGDRREKDEGEAKKKKKVSFPNRHGREMDGDDDTASRDQDEEGERIRKRRRVEEEQKEKGKRECPVLALRPGLFKEIDRQKQQGKLQRKLLAARRKQREASRVKPSTAPSDLEFEKSLKKIATKGVVKFFNVMMKLRREYAEEENEGRGRKRQRRRESYQNRRNGSRGVGANSIHLQKV